MSKDAAISFLSRIWLFGTLFKAGRATHAGAFYEFTYLLLWSILPFALGTLVLYVTTDDPNKNFFELGLHTFQNGELLIFTISMLAPILYLTLYDPDKAEPFPHKLPISTAVALIIVACASLFSLLKASSVKDFPFVFSLSIVLTIIALVFRYLAIVYHRVRLPQVTEEELRAPQKAFVEDYRRHVEEGLRVDQKNFVDKLGQHLKEQP